MLSTWSVLWFLKGGVGTYRVTVDLRFWCLYNGFPKNIGECIYRVSYLHPLTVSSDGFLLKRHNMLERHPMKLVLCLFVGLACGVC